MNRQKGAKSAFFVDVCLNAQRKSAFLQSFFGVKAPLMRFFIFKKRVT
jgi:hypothetical protein